MMMAIFEPEALLFGVIIRIPGYQEPALAAAAMIPPLGLLASNIISQKNVFGPRRKIGLGIRSRV